MSAHVHRYRAALEWTGSTGAGYERYDRGHRVQTPPAGEALALSSDPAFGGDPQRMNPEQLVVAAASSCQLLSFLALAARARIDVRSYHDEAEGEMPEDQTPVRFTQIVLRPRIVVAEGSDAERVRRLVALAHEQCYVANSLRTPVDVESEIAVGG
jgi:organic hydroperoxide reductase OsmC/OhrA